MKKNNENKATSPVEDEKIHITKSIFETNREMIQKAEEEERQKQEELEKKLAERKRKADEARDKRLEAERLELIRLKQGIIEESETIQQEETEEVKRSIWKKISDFFYLNKWWLGIAAIFGAIGIFLVHNLLTRPNPDIIVLMIGENYTMGEESQLEEYIETFIDDFNDNGKTEASVYYIPYTDNETKDYANGVMNKLFAELQNDEAAIIIGNNLAADILGDDGVLADLSAIYPENEHISKDKFMLKGTDFAAKIGVAESVVTEEWFMAIRAPRKLMHTSEKNMQELYDKDFPVFDALVNDLSE